MEVWKTDQDNQLDQALATHQHSNSSTLSPYQFACSGCKSASNNFTSKSNCYDCDNVSPGDAIIEQTDVRAQSRQCKVQGKEQNGDEVFNLLRKFNCESSIVWTDESNN